MTIKLGILREGKVPPDKRVPLTPRQVKKLGKEYPNLNIVVQTSPIRAFKDEEYADLGIPVVDNLEDCDIIMGVKEVNIEDLIPNKQFFFFSHTFKKQPYNRKLLQAIVDHKIQLTDYEVITDENENRIIGFGRYAGIVGAYNAFLTYGLKHKAYTIKPAHRCDDQKEMEAELPKVILPKNLKIAVTGFGRVGYGMKEVIDLLNIRKVSAADFLNKEFDEPVYTRLELKDYNARMDGQPFNKADFYTNGDKYLSTFSRYLKEADIYIAGHYWKEGAPFLYTRDDLKQPGIRTSVVADISCDIDGPVASTIRPSTIDDPIYGYDPKTEKEVDYMTPGAIAVMAVDNLPCELSRDASQHFGNTLIKEIFPVLLGEDPHNIIGRASETNKEGKLSPYFKYLNDYLAGNE